MKRERKLQLNTKNIVEVLFIIFRDHIGKENKISKDTLYKKVFGKKLDLSLDATLHYCRMKTNCFIVSEWSEGNYWFYVLKNKEEVRHFQNKCDEAIKGLRYVSKRAEEAVTKKWHLQEWKNQPLIGKNS